jgi:hypothetical protein
VRPKTAALLLLAAVGIAAGWLTWRHLHAVPKVNPPVAIQDNATIDFSSGKPVVKDSAQEKAIIDAAVKEMDDATKGVVFTGTASAANQAPAPTAIPATPPAAGAAPTVK